MDVWVVGWVGGWVGGSVGDQLAVRKQLNNAPAIAVCLLQ